MYVRRREREVQVQAPAKLNLFLEVLGRREDGFHEIETLMVAISIFDTIRVSSSGDDRLTFDARWMHGASAMGTVQGPGPWGDLPVGAENLVLRALCQLRDAAGVEQGARVELVKRIPSSAGLGGASSDAAAALLAANWVWGLDWSRDRLAEVAGRLGSDVPFFLGEEGRLSAAVCRGRGERIEAVPARAGLDVVVVRPPEGLATADVYRACRSADRPESIAGMIEALRRGDAALIGSRLVNRLEPAAEQLSPWIGRLREVFAKLGLWGHQMSGSGTSYFGVCRHRRHARQVAEHLRSMGWHAAAATSINASLMSVGRGASHS